MEGADPVVPFKIFWKRHLKRAARKTICTISSGKTSRFNCPGRLALVTQILSPVLTGKLIAEKNGEQQRLSRFLIQFFFVYSNFLFLLAVVFTVGIQHTKLPRCCHYAEHSELSMQFKLIPFNLIMGSQLQICCFPRATMVPRLSRVLQYFFRETPEITVQILLKPCP